MNLKILVTGGTFDKKYDPLAGSLAFSETHLPEIMSLVRLAYPYTIELIQLIDSLDMSDSDRDRIVMYAKNTKENSIVITHGTDTMAESAQRLLDAQIPKTIVFTGAMVPYAVKDSDALFNLGAACSSALYLPYGVYIAMNGRIFNAGKVRKNKELSCFEDIINP